MKNYAKHVYGGTPQTEEVYGVEGQARNNAGGVSFELNKWDMLKRFIVLGTSGGTYYVGERKLTVDAANSVRDCLAENAMRTIDTIAQVSHEGRAANNDAAIFALAMACADNSEAVRVYAYSKVNDVCRIGTHLFHFIEYVKAMRGFSRGLRSAIAKWYVNKPTDKLAYQMLKYQGRDGWTNCDVLRLCHAVPKTPEQQKLFAWAVGKGELPAVSDYTKGVLALKGGMDAAKAIREFNLTREVIPTEALNRVDVWEALLEKMPMTALVRNLGKMASIGMHKHLSPSAKLTAAKLVDEEVIKKARLHPLTIMNAKWTYDAGHGVKGSLNWSPEGNISGALEDAFYKSFEYVEPTGKNIMLALDVSGSMSWEVPGGHFTCRDASAVLAMTTMRTEPYTFVAGFTAAGGSTMRGNSDGYSSNAISTLNITHRDSLEAVINKISSLAFGRTDCALPMLYCKHEKVDVDAIVIYTDNETWSGSIHPWQALDQYQKFIGHPVKLVVVGMISSGFSIARPDYANMLDVVGFDVQTPSMISEFIRG